MPALETGNVPDGRWQLVVADRDHLGMAVSERTRKLLWGRSADRCAICRCALTADPQSADDRHAVLGVECHIVARSPGGSRAGEIGDGIDEYPNLILLCGADHKRIDDQPNYYSSDKLRQLKRDHEQWVARALEPNGSMPQMRWLVPEVLAVELRVASTGKDVLALMDRTLMYQFDHPQPASADEADLIGDFLQDLADFGDIYDEIGPANQVREQFRMTERISELAAAGLLVYIGQFTTTLEVDGRREPFPTAVVKLARHPVVADTAMP